MILKIKDNGTRKINYFQHLQTFLGIWDGVDGEVKMKFWSNMFTVEIFSGRMKWAGEGFSWSAFIGKEIWNKIHHNYDLISLAVRPEV